MPADSFENRKPSPEPSSPKENDSSWLLQPKPKPNADLDLLDKKTERALQELRDFIENSNLSLRDLKETQAVVVNLLLLNFTRETEFGGRSFVEKVERSQPFLNNQGRPFAIKFNENNQKFELSEVSSDQKTPSEKTAEQNSIRPSEQERIRIEPRGQKEKTEIIDSKEYTRRIQRIAQLVNNLLRTMERTAGLDAIGGFIGDIKTELNGIPTEKPVAQDVDKIMKEMGITDGLNDKAIDQALNEHRVVLRQWLGSWKMEYYNETAEQEKERRITTLARQTKRFVAEVESTGDMPATKNKYQAVFQNKIDQPQYWDFQNQNPNEKIAEIFGRAGVTLNKTIESKTGNYSVVYDSEMQRIDVVTESDQKK